MLIIKNYSKSYKELCVLENLNIEIPRGELLGVIGSNGAGKTTLLNSIMSNIDFKGEILINGIPNNEFIAEHRDEILFLPDNVFVYDFLTGMEFIKFTLDLNKIKFADVKEKVELFLKLFNLKNHSNRLIKEYSHGMKQKLALISVLVQSPKILLLDEPVSGLDTLSLIAFKKLLSSMTKEGTTVIFTTHILDLVEDLCDSIIVLNNKQVTRINKVKNMSKREIETRFLNIVNNQITKKIENLD